MIRALAAVAVLVVLAVPSAPADEAACLSATEQRAAIAEGRAVSLGTAIRSVRGSVRDRGNREVVKARLCRESAGLVYVLTLLARDGTVSRASVDAGSGKVVDAR
jgi:uncharacterized membrane protein YkoI